MITFVAIRETVTTVTVVRSGVKLARCLGLRVVRKELDGVLSVRLYSSGNLFMCVCPMQPLPLLPTSTPGKRVLSMKNVIVGWPEGGVIHRGGRLRKINTDRGSEGRWFKGHSALLG